VSVSTGGLVKQGGGGAEAARRAGPQLSRATVVSAAAGLPLPTNHSLPASDVSEGHHPAPDTGMTVSLEEYRTISARR